MLRASTPTKLSLARFAAIMGIHPLHFASVSTPNPSGGPVCDQTWVQYDWQDNDRVSREELARAIRAAEDQIEAQLGYRLAPAWEVDEWRPTIRPNDPTRWGSGRDVRGLGSIAEARWMRGIAGGVRATTVVSAAATIVWSDEDGDGYDETGTVTVASTGVDVCEIQAFHPGHGGEETWQLRPTQARQVGANVVVTFRRELATIDDYSEWSFRPDQMAAEPTDDTDFLTEVAIYRVWNDPSTQVSFLWEPTPNGFCGCVGGGCSRCAYGAQTGCFLWRNPELGILTAQPGSWTQADNAYSYEPFAIGRGPDLLRLYYYAGYRDNSRACRNGEMADLWAMVVARFAASMLDRPLCNCADQGKVWAEDLAFSGGIDETSTYRMSASDLRNPFGTRRGAVAAWHACTRLDLQLTRFSSGAFA